MVQPNSFPFKINSFYYPAQSKKHRGRDGEPCLVQPHLGLVASTAISASCSGSPGPCRWGTARRHGSTQGEGHCDLWQELPEEWAQKSGLMQASIRLQRREPGSCPCWAGVAAASADRELATDACLGIAQRELPPPPPK